MILTFLRGLRETCQAVVLFAVGLAILVAVVGAGLALAGLWVYFADRNLWATVAGTAMLVVAGAVFLPGDPNDDKPRWKQWD